MPRPSMGCGRLQAPGGSFESRREGVRHDLKNEATLRFTAGGQWSYPGECDGLYCPGHHMVDDEGRSGDRDDVESFAALGSSVPELRVFRAGRYAWYKGDAAGQIVSGSGSLPIPVANLGRSPLRVAFIRSARAEKLRSLEIRLALLGLPVRIFSSRGAISSCQAP